MSGFIVLCIDVCRRLELQIYRNSIGNRSSNSSDFVCDCYTAKSTALHGYQQNRILAWLEPEKYESDEAYQQLNSVMAIGSGQLTGKGYNSDATTSVKNGNFILEPQTDFIFAIIGEELGFVGCCSVIILLLLIVISCISVGMRTKDISGKLICSGVAALIGIQSFINISVATMLFPNTGISLPFVSYGQTSVVCFYIGIGLVLNAGLQQNKYQ